MLKALKQKSLSVEERLKVASYVWRREGSAKEAELTKWVCEEICSAYSKKARSPTSADMCSMLWEFLCCVIGQKGSCNFTAHVVQACISSVNSAQMGSNELLTAVAALRWSKLALGLSSLPPAFFKYDLLVALVEGSLKMCVAVIVGMDSSRADVLPALSTLLRHYGYVQSTQANPKKVFTSTCSQLLEPLLLLRRLLHTNGTAEELICVIDDIILQLFSKDHLPDITSALEGSGFEESSDKRSATSYVKVLLQTLRRMVEAGGDSLEAVHDASPVLLRCFLDQNRKENALPRSVEFHFLFTILSIVGFPVDKKSIAKQEVDESGDLMNVADKEALKQLLCMMTASGSGGRGLRALQQCLQMAHKYEVYQAVGDGGDQLPQLQSLVREVLCSYPSDVEAAMGCIRLLGKLTHKGVEPYLPVLWGVLFCQRTAEAQSVFSGFVEDCIQTYAKLKQFRVLVETQLMALRMMMDLKMAPPLTPVMSREAEGMYGRHVQELPHGQCVELMEVMVCALQEDYLAKLHPTKRSKRRKTSLTPKPGEEERENGVASCLLKMVDLFGVVVCSVPLDVWGGGLQKEKAKNVLDHLTCTLYPQLMEAACGESTLFLPALHLSYLVCQLTSSLKVVHPAVVKEVWPLPLVWCEEGHTLVPKIWDTSPSVRSADPLFSITMKHIAALCLKFGEENVLQKELASLVFEGLDVPVVTSVDWSGQLLGITEESLPTASLLLVLSQFPVLYHHCGPPHMRRVADAILGSLLCGSDDVSGSVQPHPVVAFLQSPPYQDMRGLHEALIASVLSHSAAKAPKCLHEDIKRALLWSSEGVEESDGALTCEEVFSRALTCALRRDGEEEDDPVVKAGKRTERYVKCFGAYVHVLSSIPLEALNVLTRLRLLVSCTCWSIVSHQPAASSLTANTPHLLTHVPALQSLLVCTLSSLVRQRGKRRGGATGLPQNLLPADQLAVWCYGTTKRLMNQGKADRKVVASSLMAIEKAVHWGLVNSSSCEGILKEVAGDLDNIPSNANVIDETTGYAEQCVKTISGITCKIFKELATPSYSIQKFCMELVVMVAKGVFQVIRWPPISRLHNYALLSAFVALIGSCPQLLSPLSRTHACTLFKDVVGVATHIDPTPEVPLSDELDKTLAVLDILMLPAYSSNLPAQDTPTLPEDAVLASWTSLQYHLHHLLGRYGYCKAMETYRELKASKCRMEEGPELLCRSGDPSEGECLRVVCGKVVGNMAQLLGVANREQIGSVFQHIFSECVIRCALSVSTFCICWSIIMDSKLTEDSQKELRRWLCKVLLLCMSAITVCSTDAPQVAMVTELVGRLVSIPSQVGLDGRSVVISLHVCSAMDGVCTTKPSNNSVQLLNGMCHLLSAVVRNHSPIAGASPAPVIVSVNKLIEAVIRQAQEPVGQSVGEDDRGYPFITNITHCAAMVSRLLEAVAKHPVLAKFVSYSVIAFTVSSRSHPLHQRVKQALLPGVCAMIGVCSQHDSAFIKAMLGHTDREGYQELVEEYRSFHRFTGRV